MTSIKAGFALTNEFATHSFQKKLNKMSSTPVMVVFLMATPPLCFVTNSWLIMWIILEMNTMAFCTLMSTSHQKNKKKSSETAIKYLIIQSIASAILLMYMSSNHQGILMKVMFYGGISALFLKLASVPFHSWFISVMKNSSWNSALTLMTWQKLAPIYLLTYLLNPLVMISLLMTAILGSTSQLNKKNILEILALSSIFNLSWMMTAIIMDLKVLFYFLLFYWASLTAILTIVKSMKQKSINKETFSKNKEWSTMIILTSLAGIPPTMGFLAKWVVITNLMKESLASLTTALLLISAINLYIYLRLSTNLLMKMKQSKQNSPNPPIKKTTLWITLLNAPSLMMIMLGDT